MKTDVEGRLAALSPEKRALLMLRLREKARGSGASDAICPRPDPSSFPLSHAQRRLWFLQRQQPHSPAYTFVHGLSARIRGALDVPALERAVAEIFRRHEVLRASFTEVGGEPQQRIAPPALIPFARIDLSGLPSSEAREAEVRRLFAEEGRTPIDLASDPLARITLIQLEPDHHVLLSAVHHIVADGWSTGIFLRELAHLYDAIVACRAPALPELSISYADFAHWHAERLAGRALEEQLAYWKKSLTGAPPLLDLPSDRPHPPVRSHHGDARAVRVPQPVAEALEALAVREQASLYQVLLAGFGALLSRYTRQSDVVIGSVDANRSRKELEGLIGMFSNTLALRLDASGDPTFRDLLRRVRQTALAGLSHADVPFDLVVEALHPARSLKYTPLVQVLFSLRALTGTSWSSERLSFEMVDYPAGTAKFELSVEVYPHAAGIDVTFIYNTDIFEADTVVRMLNHYRNLLESAARDPDQRLSRLALLDETERAQLLAGARGPATAYAEVRVQQEVTRIARERPEEIAVRFRGKDTTYGELVHRADQLARTLRARGVLPGSPVALYMDRSLEMIVGLLGIFQSGGAFMPIDAGTPPERVTFMLRDAGVRHVLTEQRLSGSLPADLPYVLRLDAEWPEVAGERGDPLEEITRPDDAAYIIYTSGSTGEPKGTIVPHGGLANRLLWDREILGLGPHDRVVQKTSIAFDGAFKETLLPLISGARIIVAEPGLQRDPRGLVRLMAEEGVTFAFFVPSLLRAFLQEKDVEACGRTLRLVWCGGEPLPLELLRELQARMRCVIYNGYGPTETSIGVLHHRCTEESEASIVPLGRPIANAEVHVLDRNFEQAPPLVPGEIFISGRPLGRGYLNRPGQTAARFVPSPFSSAGDRLYRTGDLARRRADGTIEFLGRTDRQVKIRGNRVELEEIERTLRQHPAIDDAVVLVKDDPGRTQRLVAYCITARGAEDPLEAARKALAARLPEYMVPSALFQVEAFPSTGSGKIDRDALAARDDMATEPEAERQAPSTDLEATLRDLWEQVLGTRVGVRDNFFEAGGHSLLLVRLQSLIESTLGREVPVATLFEHPTISAQAAHLGAADGDADTSSDEQMVRLKERASRQREAVERQQRAMRARQPLPSKGDG